MENLQAYLGAASRGGYLEKALEKVQLSRSVLFILQQCLTCVLKLGVYFYIWGGPLTHDMGLEKTDVLDLRIWGHLSPHPSTLWSSEG